MARSQIAEHCVQFKEPNAALSVRLFSVQPQSMCHQIGTLDVYEALPAQGANAIIMACARMGVDDLPEARKLVAASARWFIRNEGDVYAHRNIPVVVQGLAHVGIPADDYLLEVS